MSQEEVELDESELFEDETPLGGELAGVLPLGGAKGMGHGGGPGALLDAPGSSESDSDDGIHLDSEGSSSDADDEVEQTLHDRIQSLQSSLDAPAPVHELGVSHTGSQLGSLKSFGSNRGGRLLFGSLSDGDIASGGHLAASMPVTTPINAGRRWIEPQARPSNAALERSYNLASSMPISIPLMQRRRASSGNLDAMGREQAATFVPPHMLFRQEDVVEGEGPLGVGKMGISPSAAVKRERLIARNAILRSTGFIEVQTLAGAAPIGEVLDPVKEQLLAGGLPGSMAVGVPGGARMERKPTAASSLTRLLGTSK